MSSTAWTLDTRRRLELVGRLGLGALSALERARPSRVLPLFVVTQWLAVLGFALTVRHSGWTFYQGGDQLWFYTTGWLLAHGHVGYAGVGYLWPTLLAPIARVAGANVQNAYPAIVLVNVLVLLPVATLAFFGIARRIAGRVFGYWATALWVGLPFIGILYTSAGYHQRFTELFLPQALGLTALSDFPALVAAVVSGYFCTKIVLDRNPRAVDGLAAGLAAGAAIAIKPSAALFLGGPLLALYDARRLRPAVHFVAGMLPAAITLVLWKVRTIGHLPFAMPYETARLAAGPLLLPLGLDFHRYLNLDWHHLAQELDNLRGYFWSQRLIEWAPIAGLFGLFRRVPGIAVLAGGWLGTFVIVKGTYDGATLQDGSLLRILIPAFPAFVLLVAGIPLLIPRLPGLIPFEEPVERPARPGRRTLVTLAAAVLLTAVVPFGAVAALPLSSSPRVAQTAFTNGPVPAQVDLGLRARLQPDGSVKLTWRPQATAGGPLFYHVFRGPADWHDYTCPSTGGALQCYVSMLDVGTTRATSFVNFPPAGRWSYRVGVAANWLNDTSLGDVYVLSSPVVLTLR